MTRRRPRGLTEEDRALWNRVRKTAVPLRPDAPHPIGNLPEAVEPPKPEAPRREPIEPFRIGEKASDTALPARSAPTVGMDRKRFTQLKRGKMKPEARIDLHGMTVAQAHPALNRFILDSQAAGRRLVLVITGKGDGAAAAGFPEGRGILRRQVPTWLRSAPLSSAVMDVTEAHLRHGGAGAFYVYLRRNR